MHGPSFWFDTRIYLAVAASLLVIIIFYNKYVAILGAILLYVLYLYGRERYVERQKALSDYLESMTHHIDQASFYALQHLPIGIAIIDETGRLHWQNSVLASWMSAGLDPGESILDVWPELDIEVLLSKDGQHNIKIEDKFYQIIHKTLPESLDKKKLLLLYITDITDIENLRKNCHDAMPVLAYVQVDNYDDVLTGLTDNQRTGILSEVHQRLGEWVTEHNGVFKKYAEDLYIAIFNRKALDRLLHEKFEILDRVRTIHGGNKIPVTISMGVAAEESSIMILGQRAQSGLDLALGRGGDQAAVYIESKVQFYGGKTKAVEKNTRVKARIVSQALYELIGDADNILVMGHSNEDFDSLGAALGVLKMAAHLEKPVNIVVSQPSLAVGKLKELLPDYETYYNIFKTPDQAKELVREDTLLFIVDTHRPELTAAPDLLSLVDSRIVIDHHRRSENFVVNPLLVYLEPSASSTSELMVELLMYFDEQMSLNRLEATLLYAGIIVDTKNFTVQTGVRTFEAASYLRRAGADPTLVQQLFRVDYATLKSRAEIITNTQMLPGGMVIATCPNVVKNAQIVAAQTADMLLNIESVKASFVLVPLDGSVNISARSQGDVNVQVLMEALGGGGHQTVAGAQLKNTDIETAKAKVVEIVINYIEESVKHESNTAARSEKTR